MNEGLLTRLKPPVSVPPRPSHGGRINPTVASILQSPFHWLLSRRLMLVTVKGRRTETVYTIPVEYRELDALVIVLVPSASSRTWWRNFIDPAYAQVTIRGWRTAAQGFAPAPGSAEFSQAFEQAFRIRRPFGRKFGVKFDNAGLTDEQRAHLAQTARVVVFDRDPEQRVSSPASTAPALRAVSPQAEAVVDDAAEDDLADLLGPLLAELPLEARPAAFALVQRIASELYRVWGKQAEDDSVREVLDACAVRADDIASRVEGAVPGALAIQETVANAHPNLAANYFEMFEGRSPASKFAFQAEIERETAETWRLLAETSPPHVRGVLLECSYLEDQNASAVEPLVDPAPTS